MSLKPLTKVTLPSSVVTDLHIGDLLRNDDREGRVFGRIITIKSRGIWKEMWIDTTDKEERHERTGGDDRPHQDGDPAEALAGRVVR